MLGVSETGVTKEKPIEQQVFGLPGSSLLLSTVSFSNSAMKKIGYLEHRTSKGGDNL